MPRYIAPVEDMLFVMHELAGFDEIAKLPGCGDLTPDLLRSILEEAGRFASEVLLPLNQPGDRHGARVESGVVTTPPGFKDAYKKFVDAGWNAVPCPPKFGGQGMPQLLAMALREMWDAANMSFSLCSMLTQGAVEAIETHASEELKRRFLPKLVSGEWTGTMNLTEPQAGSDLAAVRTRAVPEGDHYRISGTKVFITYGEHDWTENIVHTVLARLPDAPEGVKGISLFIVPKYLVNPDGSLGARNDVHCVSLEHKLGIHASPTAMLSYGEKGGAIGYLVGQPNRGLEYMFLMMNRARVAVGMEGIALCERAYQEALAYARERVQGRPIGASESGRAPIIHHPDVRRMLMSMKAQAEATRALAYYATANLDKALRHPDAKTRARAQAIADLLVPVVKGWSTEQAVEVASTGVQVHGGMGFIEETGAAQLLRDARITTIYEGTTGIQANDLIGRKVARDAGATVKSVISEMQQTCRQIGELRGEDFKAIGTSLASGVTALEQSTHFLLDTHGADPRAAFAGSVPYLMLLGVVAGGWQMARAAMAAQKRLAAGGDKRFHETKIGTARFYADHLLPRAGAYRHEILNGAASTLRLEEAQF
ncbi:MAG: acyl-CoA dehydrogenase [Sulfurifustaceae bacterium]